MLKWLPLLCLFIIATLEGALATSADQFGIEGPWRQVETTAGACPKCGLNIARKGGAFDVTANNGWSATVASGRTSNPIETIGTGIWSIKNRGWVSGRSFDIALRLMGQRLHMEMRVRMPDGSSRLIKAVFERVWLGA